MDIADELLHTSAMRHFGKALFALFILFTLYAVGTGLASIVRARTKTVASVPCEGREYLVLRKDYAEKDRFFLYLTLEERGSGLRLEWPRETRTIPRAGESITLWSSGTEPKKFLDLSLAKDSGAIESHLACLRQIMPAVREALLGIVPPYAGVPEFISRDDGAVLLWR